MDSKDLEAILEAGEGQKVEFKRSANNIGKEIVAFANSSGGKLIIGVENEGDIFGVSSPNDTKSRIRDVARNCDPSVMIDEIEKVDDTLVVEIPPSQQAHQYSGAFYVREGANSQKLNKTEVTELLHSKGELEWDEIKNNEFVYPQDFSREAFKEFIERTDISSDSVSTKFLLRNLGIAKFDGGALNFTNAGVLMFSKNPKQFFIQAEIQCVNWENEEKDSYTDREIISAPLIESVNRAIDFVIENIDSRTVIESRTRNEKPEIPEAVLREAIANAVMHRDYASSRESVQIFIYPSRIEIRNPGGLVPGMRREDLGKKSVRRNPIVADMLDRAGFVERSGTGINRMIRRMKDEGFPEPTFNMNSHFEVILSRERGAEIPDLTDADLTSRQKEELKYAYRNGRITTSKAAEIIDEDVTDQTFYLDLRDMVKKEFLERKGKGKGTYYVPKTGEN